MSESNMTGDNTELDTLKGEPQADAQLEDVKPVKDSDEKINLKVRLRPACSGPYHRSFYDFTTPQIMTSEGAEVHFKIKRGLRLDRLAEAYAKKIGRDISSIRYATAFCINWCAQRSDDTRNRRLLYDGTRIQDDDTPESLDMEDNGIIVFSFKQQISGADTELCIQILST